jgi:hypothetical protein
VSSMTETGRAIAVVWHVLEINATCFRYGTLVVFLGTDGAAAGTFDYPIVRVDYETRWTEREELVLGGDLVAPIAQASMETT